MNEKVTMTRLRYAPLLVFQIILTILYFCFTKYADVEEIAQNQITGFADTHVMIFIGFAYLMTFLKKYCYSATGYNLLLAALVIQWSLLCQGFFHMKDGKIAISLKNLLEADIMSATVLITFGALLGLASGTQLLFIAVVEAAVGCVNLYLCEKVYEISDIGGSMAIHTYGAYFGLGVSAALRLRKSSSEHTPPPVVATVTAQHGQGVGASIPIQKERIRLDGPNYTSDVTAMIGTIFLWIYWPSFNSGLAGSEVERQRAIVNTYLSLASCTVVTFMLSAAVSHKPGKLDMVHIQNSTLAGGVAVGAVANMYIGPGGAIAIGIGAAFISVLGYRYLTPQLEKLGIQDTCGVNNLHGMPGIYSGLLSVLFAGLATTEAYGTELGDIFPATSSIADGQAVADPRSVGMQAAYQLAALGTTLGLALGTGVLSGLIVKTKIFSPLEEKERYDDEMNWELP
ncbi:hypothetical protein PYW07_012422 [Mythimna separata]|uniref:Ammonium transporter AmtB-like domain-containing protein n=1 Tax=Mythimna separata TaxID=271217 RepID=A0AAD7YMZ1_MYTSE|nr:hypothetical protein PYW07_012422 [Mythimna separata]